MTPAAAIRLRRAQVRSRPAPRKRLPRTQPPDGAERIYESELLAIVEAMRAAVERRVLPVLERMAEDREDRQDEALPDFGRLIREAELEFERTITQKTIEGVGAKVGEQVDMFASRQVTRQIRAVLPIDVGESFGASAREIADFTAEGVDLIKSMNRDYFLEVQLQIEEGFAQGRRASSIAKDINRRGEVSESRARFIARDQIAKLNGKLVQKRQTELGLKSYIWRTSGDSRTRESHRRLEGKVFQWDDPPVVDERTGRKEHPGGDYQCRCSAEPNIDELLDDLEAQDLPPVPAEVGVDLPAAARPPDPVLPDLERILPPAPLPSTLPRLPGQFVPERLSFPSLEVMEARARRGRRRHP